MTPAMAYSGAGLAITKSFEGLRLAAYRDIGGVLTNGYGNTQGVVAGSTITQAQADADLKANMRAAVAAVNRLVIVPLTQGQFDACCDFTYNVGQRNFATSKLLRLINAKDFAGAAAQFVAWDKVDGKAIAGLLRRRIAEKNEFERVT